MEGNAVLKNNKIKKHKRKKIDVITLSCHARWRACSPASLPTEAAVTEAKRTALGRKRAGDVEGAKAALRAAKAHQAELEDTRALLA